MINNFIMLPCSYQGNWLHSTPIWGNAVCFLQKLVDFQCIIITQTCGSEAKFIISMETTKCVFLSRVYTNFGACKPKSNTNSQRICKHKCETFCCIGPTTFLGSGI